MGKIKSISNAHLQADIRQHPERVLSNMDAVLINGTQLLLDLVYDSIGFNSIPDDILRHLVIARVSQPMSKSAIVEYL